MTGIGIATAFASLILLMIAVPIINRISVLISRRATAIEPEPASTVSKQIDDSAKDKALAAVVAVTALLASRPPGESGTN